MPRPKLDPAKKKSGAIQLRLNEPERVVFNQLVSAMANENPAGEMTDAGALRASVAEAMRSRGIAWPRQASDAALPAEPPTISEPVRERFLDREELEGPAPGQGKKKVMAKGRRA